MKRTILIVSLILVVGCISLALRPFMPATRPIAPMQAYLNGHFPSSPPSTGSSWELRDPMPDLTFNFPVRMRPYPLSDEVMILEKVGRLWRVDVAQQRKTILLDIQDRVFKLGEGGSVGMILHPDFGNPGAPDKQLLFVYYRTKPQVEEWSESGFNRLSKFQWDEQRGQFDPDSEEILFQQYDRTTWHNGGSMFFGPEGFLYIGVGDEGFDEFQAVSTQRLDGGFFSGIMRIDVDNDPTRSHPIRRQPKANGPLLPGWTGETFSQGYSIPNDNPWLSEEGKYLEEFYAIGLRAPYAIYFDPETELIWVGDVGAGFREEINLVEKGDNLQWPYLEGTAATTGFSKPDSFIGNEKPVYREYERSVGSCIIGGQVYKGTKFPQLNGKYIFADYNRHKVMSLTQTGSRNEPDIDLLLTLQGQPVQIPESPGITGVYPQENGEIFILVKGTGENNKGKVFSLQQSTSVPEPPGRLSDLGVFSDLQTLATAPGIIPYKVNSPLWSDRALKRRWMVLPNDGIFDSQEEQIEFSSFQEWEFPEGTVFIKHFDLPLSNDPNPEIAKLETRFFIIGEGGRSYGLTYKWNEQGTDAFLLGGGASRSFDIYEDGAFAYQQTWDFPSRDQCLSCHNENAQYVLGVKTHQLNSDLYYPDLQADMNQLEYLNQRSIFHRDIGTPDKYQRAHSIEDASVPIDLRIRSYMDANCASCHRLGGVSGVSMDFRFNMPLRLQNIVYFPTQSHASDPSRYLVEPGSHERSELWIRDASNEATRMPPLGRNIVDQGYVSLLAEWIDHLPQSQEPYTEFTLFPNPSRGWLVVNLPDEWEAPYEIRVYTLAGRLVYENKTELPSVYLDFTRHGPSTYLLEVKSKGQTSRRKFIIQ